jgi:Thioester domain
VKTRKYLCLGVTALLFLLANSAHADSITNLQLYDGSAAPTATINFTGADGTGSNSEYVYADPQVSGGTTAPLFYCVDLWHDNSVGASYTITPVGSMVFTNSTFGDVDNRIGWLMSQEQSTAAERAAVQLAIWYTVDSKGFSMSSGDSTITSEYNALINFAGYNPGVTYAADFWQATHDSTNTLYQDLVSAHTGGVNTFGSVPEPPAHVLMSISVLFFALLTWWRRPC